MIYLRSALFNVAFYIVLLCLIIGGLPLLLFDYRYVFKLGRAWGYSSLWLLDKICGLKVEYRGAEKIPKGGFLIAPKHQSIWETFALLPFFDDFTFVLKRELTYIPFFGWYLWKSRQIAIDRAKGATALEQVAARAKEVLAAGRAIFIFPDGTRRPPGAPPKYKFGVAHVYGETGARCLPVALNSGLFWPRRSFIRRPGKVLVEFLDPIEPGLDKQVFLAELQARLEAACNRLNQESVQAQPELRAVLIEGSRA